MDKPTPVYVYQEFPRILYHVGGTVIVNNQEEKDLYIDKGYETMPIKMNRAEEVQALIVFHKTEIISLEKELKALLRVKEITPQLPEPPIPEPPKEPAPAESKAITTVVKLVEEK